LVSTALLLRCSSLTCHHSRSDIPGIAEILSYLTRLVLLAQILHDKVIIKKDSGIWARQEKDVGDGQMDGTNLKPVMCIDGVDFKRTYSNSCVGIFNMLGIEAARAAITKELRVTLECNVIAITRHSINRARTGALMNSSFEETMKVLTDAAAVEEQDDCHELAENVMLGQMAPMGTDRRRRDTGTSRDDNARQ
ncbi:hypothetical protein CERSUDRAFT_78787, partial [Gelatoporia subvermispora B]